MGKGFLKVRQIIHRSKSFKMETGFSMLEAVVVVGVLLALAVSGFLSYGPIIDNAKKAKVKSAASEIHTGVLVASMDSDTNTKPQDVIDAWNGSTDQIFVEILKPAAGEISANGDYCVQATHKQNPLIIARTGACEGVPGGPPADTGGGGGTPPILGGSECALMTVYDELACWHAILMKAEADYEAANGHYFGPAEYNDQTSYPFSPPELASSPLKWSTSQEIWRDTDPQWDYNYFSSVMIDRDGNFWQGGYYHELNGPGSAPDQLKTQDMTNSDGSKTPLNILTACDFVTPNTLYSECGTAGIAPDKYIVTTSNSDSIAHDDINKVIQKQFINVRDAKVFYGGFGTAVDVKGWANTTYPTKIFNVDNTYNGFTRVMVTAPNGDLYTEEVSFNKTNTKMPAAQFMYVFRYTPEMVQRVCTRPFTGAYNQKSDVQTCSAMGYPDFHG